MSSRRTTVLSVTISTVLSMSALQAQAQAQQSAPVATALEEIVVTSRRVEESLQDTPVSVSAFQPSDIEKLNLENVGDAAKFTPGFTTTAGPTGGNDGFYFIRGVGQTDLNSATDPGVATYVDGVYLGRVIGSSFDTSDIDQIEVLRGPQGTLFGRNTMGGAINVTTHTPELGQFGGKLSVEGGDYDMAGVKGRIDFPLGDMAAGTISGTWREQEGYATRASDGETFGDNETKAARAKFVFEPTDEVRASLGFDRTEVEGTAAHNILTAFNGAAVSPLGVPMVPGVGAAVNDGSDLFLNQSSIDPDMFLDVTGGNATVEWKGETYGFKSITAYRQLEQFHPNDFDGSPYTFYDGSFYTDQDQISQEFQFSADIGEHRLVLGGYFYEEESFHNNAISMGGNNGCLPFFSPNAYPVCANPGLYATPGVDAQLRQNQRINVEVSAYAAFAHLNMHFTERLSGSLGVRWTEETKEQSYDFSITNPNGVANFAGIPQTGVGFIPAELPTFSPRNPNITAPTSYEKTWSEVTPSASLEFRPLDGLMVYGSYSEGFKSGGFAGRPTPGPGGVWLPIPAFDPEHLSTYEVGLKSEFADSRVRLNVAAYFSDYEDIQLLVLDGDTGFFNTLNATAEIEGAEVELLALPFPALQLQATAAYNDNEYTEVPRDNGGNPLLPPNGRLPLTPELTYSFGADYTFDFAGGGALALHADYSWRDDVFFGAENGANAIGESVGLVGARVTFTFPDDTFSVSAWGANLTDEEYFSNGQDVVGPLGVAFSSVGAPRTWGVEATYKFGAK